MNVRNRLSLKVDSRKDVISIGSIVRRRLEFLCGIQEDNFR